MSQSWRYRLESGKRLAFNLPVPYCNCGMSYTFSEKQQMKTGLVATSISALFYSGIAWGITEFIDGGRKDFFGPWVFWSGYEQLMLSLNLSSASLFGASMAVEGQ